MIFRWGGDEFFLIMLGMSADLAEQRMACLENLLKEITIEERGETFSVGVSFGFRDFDGIRELETAIKAADEEMYRNKQNRKMKLGAIIHKMPIRSRLSG